MTVQFSTKTVLAKLNARFGVGTISVFVFLTVAIFIAALAEPWTRWWVLLVLVSGALVAIGVRLKWKDGSL